MPRDLWDRVASVQRSLFRVATPTAPDPLLERALVLCRDMDWLDRALLLDMLRQIDCVGHQKLLSKLGPDEAVDGRAEAKPPTSLFKVMTGLPAAPPKRQITLEETFERQVRRRVQG